MEDGSDISRGRWCKFEAQRGWICTHEYRMYRVRLDRDLCDSSIGAVAEDDGMEVRAISGDSRSRGISIGYTLSHDDSGGAELAAGVRPGRSCQTLASMLVSRGVRAARTTPARRHIRGRARRTEARAPVARLLASSSVHPSV
jgi:hypothetical protein